MLYQPYSCTAGAGEEIAEEIIQTTSGALSIIGSTYIVADVLKKLRSRRTTRTDSYQRIMLGLSFFDIITSFFDSFMGTWMTSAETDWLMAAGNQASCTAQGFFTAFGFMGSYGYQMALSLNILVLIAFGWSQKKFARTIERPMHLAILSGALAYAIVPLPLQSYNPSCGQCLWDVIYDECDDPATADGELCVVRGSEKIRDQYWQVFWGVLWTMIVFCTVAMIWVYLSVRRQENKMKRYRYDENHNRESKRIRKILLLYTLALYLCWGFPFTLIFVSIELGLWPSKIPFGVRALCETLIPLAGFFNMLVYFLPKCLKYQRDNLGTWLVTAYFRILIPSIRCYSCYGGGDGDGDGDAEEQIADMGMNFAKYNTSGKPTAASATSSLPANSTKENAGGDIEEVKEPDGEIPVENVVQVM